MRRLTEEQADAAYTVLVKHAGALEDSRGYERFSFVHAHTKAAHVCSEWRFQGKLGFGGKFRNNGNRDAPYVTCYPEDLTEGRQAIIDTTNAALAVVFTPTTL